MRHAAVLLALLAAGCAAPEAPVPAATPSQPAATAAEPDAAAAAPDASEAPTGGERAPRGSVVLMDGRAKNLGGDDALYAHLARLSRELGVTIVVDEGVSLRASPLGPCGLPARDAIDALARANRCEVVYRPER